jgi:catechol 2,3-dioxygenase-like lactoylglutathione lyase family enzyme
MYFLRPDECGNGSGVARTLGDVSGNSLNHIGLTVLDVERSVVFYRDVAGMEVWSRRQMQGEWFDTLTHNHGAVIDVAMLRLGSFTLQLVQYLEAGGDVLPVAHHHVGNPHLCINVADVDTMHDRAVAHGGLAPTPIVDILGSGIRSFYVRDPDGVPVEFLQMRADA